MFKVPCETDQEGPRGDRDQFYADVTAMLQARRLQVPDRLRWEAGINKERRWIMEKMLDRRCAMTFDGVVRIANGPNPARGTYRLRRIVDELVRDGELGVQHQPDGDDRYYVPGGPSDPRA